MKKEGKKTLKEDIDLSVMDSSIKVKLPILLKLTLTYHLPQKTLFVPFFLA
ncbi:MAG: hypothetical protein LBN01_02020 [Endomicrobium sp.]|nr:hypothetical protein [Endomicrobium sp.]